MKLYVYFCQLYFTSMSNLIYTKKSVHEKANPCEAEFLCQLYRGFKTYIHGVWI